MDFRQLFASKPLDVLLKEAQGDQRLKRTLGPVNLTALGIGAVIGSGIFVSTGKAAHDVAGPALMVSYVVAGLTCWLYVIELLPPKVHKLQIRAAQTRKGNHRHVRLPVVFAVDMKTGHAHFFRRLFFPARRHQPADFFLGNLVNLNLIFFAAGEEHR